MRVYNNNWYVRRIIGLGDLAQDRHIPGILILNSKLSIEQTIEELILIAEGFFDEEYQDQIVNLPLP